jgi:adenosylcobinamide hydrolase
MRYFLHNDTLFIRGTFRAASTGIRGGIGNVSTVFNHTVPPGWNNPDPERELDLIIAREGLPEDCFGLLTAVCQNNACILQYDYITVFITAGTGTYDVPGNNTINIIIHSSEGLSDGGLLEALMVATEAKVSSLRREGRLITGTATDAVITASEGMPVHAFCGKKTGPGMRIFAAVEYGVSEALKRHEGEIRRKRPSFFIFSRYGGDHWAEWVPEDCPYYPCHFPGQRCDYCYCPFYPCRDESLGEWVQSSHNGRVWNCSGCTLLHQPPVADYLNKNPEASLNELKALECSEKKG